MIGSFVAGLASAKPARPGRLLMGSPEVRIEARGIVGAGDARAWAFSCWRCHGEV